jgi:enterochelin esterase-like enzyme
MNEMIFVGVNGNNKLRGSFFVNSPVIGNWEDYIIKDVIGYIDSNYRTIPNSASRGIAGFSMGGFGAFNLSFKHPDIFSVVYCLSPGLFDQNGLIDAMKQWDLTFKNAYGAAFSPNAENPYPYANILNLNASDDTNKNIKSAWENGFGNLQGKIANYQILGKPLKAIRIEYGLNDYYPWIPNGCKYLSQLLAEKNIEHDLLTFQGNHEILISVLKKDMFPFFSKNLEIQ